jgi:gas vesicle protein GvpA/GvpJ/GvpM family
MSDVPERWSNEQVALVDLIDRVIGGGVVITGDIVLGIADVDLVYVGLQLVIAPAHEVEQSISLRRRSA